MARQRNTQSVAIILLILLGIAAAVYFVVKPKQAAAPTVNGNTNIACPQDAKLCPDGTSVNRVAPTCDFAACPTASNLNTNTVTNTSSTAKTTYTDTEFGFSLQYPASWKETKSESGTGNDRIVGYSFSNGTVGVALTVAPTALEGMILDSFSVTTQSTVTINGQTATRAQGASAKDGSRLDLLIFRHSGKIFFLNGTSDNVDTIGATFTFSS